MRSKVLAWLGVSLLVLMLAAVPFMAACEEDVTPPPADDEDVTPPPADDEDVEVIELTYGSFMPEVDDHEVLAQEWAERIEEQTNGRVHFTMYFGGTLISMLEGFQEIVDGVADCGTATPAYSPVGYDIGKACMTFFYGCSDTEVILRVYHEVYDQFPEIQAELAAVHPLVFRPMTTYHLFTGNTPVRSLDDIDGLTIKGTASLVDWLNALGAEGVSVGTPDLYINVQKSIIDGYLHNFMVSETYKLYEVVDYCTILNVTPNPTPTVMFNLDVWNSLPSDVQQIIEENSAWMEAEVVLADQVCDQTGLDNSLAAGLEVIELPAEDLAEAYAALDALNLQLAADLDAKGYPGTEILTEVRRLIELYCEE